ncbi:hypothetical protein ABMA10_00245 [Plantibacter sp. RU18]
MRTKRAILETAAQILPLAPQSSLADIAQTADVSRSTIHRYFPERGSLIRALAVHAYELSDAAITEVADDFTDPVERLRAIALNQLDIGPLMTFLYQDPAISADEAFWQRLREDGDPIDPILEAVAGPRPRLPIAWMRRAYWNVLYVGWETAMDRSMTRSEIADAIVVTLCTGALSSHEQ